MQIDTRRLPPIAILSPEEAERQAEQTRNGLYKLLPPEIFWRERQPFLDDKGYVLRPRYNSDWKPSWIGTNIHPQFCEDSIFIRNYMVIDSMRRDDGTLVAIKSTRKEGQELDIALFLSSLQQLDNHCVPVIEILQDPFDQTRTLMIMPYLRPFNDPEFTVVGDVMDFVSQMLEGLTFLHRLRIAHRDIAPLNVMMDGRSLYPNGHHPVRIDSSPDGIEELTPLPRIDNPVRYFYVDFGLSVRFPPGASHYVIGDVGRDDEVPELSSTVPYDAFKADIYALGNLFDKEFVQQYLHLEPFQPLIDSMKQRDPQARPPADELLSQFKQIRDHMNGSLYRWRLAPKSEPTLERVFFDTVAVARQGYSQLRRLIG